jgi:hypothetical protein
VPLLVGSLLRPVLWFHYLSISLLELLQILCNGHIFPLIVKIADAFTTTLGSMHQEEQIKLGEAC